MTGKVKSGFTLIEVLVVVIIIAALAGMVVPRLLPHITTSKKRIAQADIANITTALQTFFLDYQRYPTTEEGLKALVAPPAGGVSREPYLDKIPRDPWGKPYRYLYPGTHNTSGFDLWSEGPTDSPEDDITNWEK